MPVIVRLLVHFKRSRKPPTHLCFVPTYFRGEVIRSRSLRWDQKRPMSHTPYPAQPRLGSGREDNGQQETKSGKRRAHLHSVCPLPLCPPWGLGQGQVQPPQGFRWTRPALHSPSASPTASSLDGMDVSGHFGVPAAAPPP